MRTNRRPIAVLAALLLAAASCGSAAETEPDQAAEASADTARSGADSPAEGSGVRLVDVDEAATIHRDRPAELVVLDVRTPDEFAEGHLEGAIMIDFYSPDFEAELAELDRDVPYLLYCRSGNRSGQTRSLMSDLGFADVADVDGGILAWTGQGLPLVTP